MAPMGTHRRDVDNTWLGPQGTLAPVMLYRLLWVDTNCFPDHDWALTVWKPGSLYLNGSQSVVPKTEASASWANSRAPPQIY